MSRFWERKKKNNIHDIVVGATEFTVCLIEHAIYCNTKCRYFDKGYCTPFCLIAFAESLTIFVRPFIFTCEKARIIVKSTFYVSATSTCEEREEQKFYVYLVLAYCNF